MNNDKRTTQTIEWLICNVNSGKQLINCINRLIMNYYKNCDPISAEEINDLYELEQSKRFFMYLDKEILTNQKI